MAWRYRKSVKLFPGVRLNLSSRGISTTIGVRGMSVNISNRGTFLNAGVPGTGLSNRTKLSGPGPSPTPPVPAIESSSHPALTPAPAYLDYLPPPEPAEEIGAIKSADADEVTSEGLEGLRTTLYEAHAERKEIERLIAEGKNVLSTESRRLQTWEKSWLKRLFLKKQIEKTRATVTERQEMLNELAEQRQQCLVNVDLDLDDKFQAALEQVGSAFAALASSEKVWDVTSEASTDSSMRSSAAVEVRRKEVRFDRTGIEVIACRHEPLHLANANGGDLYIYPAFVLISNDDGRLGLIDLDHTSVEFKRQQFLEEQGVPRDSEVVGKTWKKVNKNGSPDLRFKGNYEIPVALYAELLFESPTGLREEYMISNVEAAEAFSGAFDRYRKLVAMHLP